MALCPELYKLLENKFGSVKIVHHGEPLSLRYGPPDSKGYRKTTILQHGETYRVACCFCSDTRHRLWINHRWGQYDPIAGYNLHFLAHCFNENCLADAGAAHYLETMVFGHSNHKRKLAVLPTSKPISIIRKAELPGIVTPLHLLSEDHHSKNYLRSRGYDPDLLSHSLNISYCHEAKEGFSLAANRIIIPIQLHNSLVGWQARYIGDKNWKECHFPKYWSMPNMSRSSILYNYDLAKDFNYVVITEGPSDVWSVGKSAIATLGKCISQQQKELIIRTWKTAIIFLDADAHDEAVAIRDDLSRSMSNVLLINPSSKDPGQMTTNEVWQLIESEAKKANLNSIF